VGYYQKLYFPNWLFYYITDLDVVLFFNEKKDQLIEDSG